MQIPSACDVVIIGGGPAGTSAATQLAKKGYDVVLFEKAKHPREHVGESLIPHFWRYTDELGVSEKILAEGFQEKTGGTVVWNGRIQQVSFSDFAYDRRALHVERARFDHILFQHCQENGAKTFERVMVKSVRFAEEAGGKQTVVWRDIDAATDGEIECEFVVDASGQASVLGRQLDIWEIDEDFRFVSLWGYFKGAKYVALDGKAHPFEKSREIKPTTFVTALKDGDGAWSWLWHITMRENTSVGLVISREELARAKANYESLEAYYRETCSTTPIINQLLEDATYEGEFSAIRDFSYRVKQAAGPGYLMIGDAATFIDPVFSQGIVLAFYTANLASWAIDRAMKRPEDTERTMAMYSHQLLMRADMARSMALPSYMPPEVSEAGRTAVGFESKQEQKLMRVAAGLTNRSQNFHTLVGGQEDEEDTIKILESIEF
ncbi:NAD(P)/FAD-dependent oxidoreductase [Plesiocystis pacifica]|uniref:NAD(P)/FAD-dependent oxidoreductase n=1 Tax=Plesiocystis pacifica TaxID=191768 RepID=UPI0003186838|nr:NAD(P)/FAD-dependent oxidoreductase [Plesiocystis pacifica]